jgi:hypothetical protein
MRQTMILLSAAFALLVLSSTTSAQGRGGGGGGQAPGTAPAAQAAPKGPVEVILIGCLERAGNNYTLKDFRDGNTYQINAPANVVAPAESLAWHAGHQLEVKGTLEPGGGATRLRASSIAYLAAKCQK